MLLRRLFSSSSLKRTPLHAMHVKAGGKMVDFCGWSMPVIYGDQTIAESVLHTRADDKASLFDVSHMCQLLIEGAARHALAARLFTADTRALRPNEAAYTLMCNERGGIIDDAIVSSRDDETLYVVVNAGNADTDIAHIREQMRANEPAQLTVLSPDLSLLALQGRGAERALTRLRAQASPPLPAAFMRNERVSLSLGGRHVPALVTRCGYTGEDGFEVSVAADEAEAVAAALLADDARVKWAGLGARDALRLEAGLCLHGNDIDASTTPIEAGLAWAIAKSRRDAVAGDDAFLGAAVVLGQLRAPATVARRRVGLCVDGAPARAHADVLHAESGARVGVVTSGGYSPTLKAAIAMAYLDKPHHTAGHSPLAVKVRNKTFSASIEKMPFVPNTYKHGEKAE